MSNWLHNISDDALFEAVQFAHKMRERAGVEFPGWAVRAQIVMDLHLGKERSQRDYARLFGWKRSTLRERWQGIMQDVAWWVSSGGRFADERVPAWRNLPAEWKAWVQQQSAATERSDSVPPADGNSGDGTAPPSAPGEATGPDATPPRWGGAISGEASGEGAALPSPSRTGRRQGQERSDSGRQGQKNFTAHEPPTYRPKNGSNGAENGKSPPTNRPLTAHHLLQAFSPIIQNTTPYSSSSPDSARLQPDAPESAEEVRLYAVHLDEHGFHRGKHRHSCCCYVGDFFDRYSDPQVGWRGNDGKPLRNWKHAFRRWIQCQRGDPASCTCSAKKPNGQHPASSQARTNRGRGGIQIGDMLDHPTAVRYHATFPNGTNWNSIFDDTEDGAHLPPSAKRWRVKR